MFEGKVREHEAEVGRSHAVQARLQQVSNILGTFFKAIFWRDIS